MLERYYRELLNFLSHRLGDRHLAADLTQESFARAYAAHQSAPIEEPRAFLYTTARHLMTDHHRRALVRGDAVWQLPDPDSSLEVNEPPGPSALEPESIMQGRQRLAAIERALMSLSPRPREAFVLYKIEGLSRPEVAARMGVGVRTVETHLAVAMAACMHELQNSEGRKDASD